MKSLMLLNARKRRRRRRSRRNPVGSTAAFRAGFPSSMGRRRKRRGSTRRRRRMLSIRRYRLPGGRAGLAVRARKIYVSRRGRKAALIVARNPRRRYRMNPLGGNILGQVKSVFSRENLTIAGGGLAAFLLTKYLQNMTTKSVDPTTKLETAKPTLPMPESPESAKLARIGYAAGIPILGAMLTRRFSPGLAKGMFYAGLINGAIEAFTQYGDDKTKEVFGLKEYLDYTPMSSLNATPGYSAINQFSTVRPMNGALSNSSAFPADAWGR